MKLFITLNVLTHNEEFPVPEPPFEMDVFPDHIMRVIPHPDNEGYSLVLLYGEEYWMTVQNNREWIVKQIEDHHQTMFFGTDEQQPGNPWD